MSFSKAGQYGEALGEFSELVRQYPNSNRREESLYRIGDCYRLLGKPEDALAAFLFVLKEYPDGAFAATAKLRAGDLLYRKQQYAQALPFFEGALASGQGDTRLAAQYMRAVAQLQIPEQSAQGRAGLEALIGDPNAKNYIALAGQILADDYEKGGELRKAMAAWRQVLAASPQPEAQALATARAGWIALQLGEPKEAEALFVKTRNLSSGARATSEPRKIANTGLLKIYHAGRRYADVITLTGAEGAQFLDGVKEERMFAVAHALFQLNKWKESVAEFDRFLAAYGDRPASSAAAYERLLARAQMDPAWLASDAAEFLKRYPDSPLALQVHFLFAQNLAAQKKHQEALPLWQALYAKLTTESKTPKDIPPEVVTFELANALFELGQWEEAAGTYDEFADKFGTNSGAIAARVRQAIASQNAGKVKSASTAWEEVQQMAPEKSKERRMALEQLGLIYHQAGDSRAAADRFRSLVAEFPDTPIRAFAFWVIADDALAHKDYAAAEPALLEARLGDKTTWELPANERLALLAFSTKDAKKLARYASEYELAGAAAKSAPPLPAALYFWLGNEHRKKGQNGAAILAFEKVVNHPDPAEFAVPVLWELAQAFYEQKDFPRAVECFEKYRKSRPDLANSNEVLLAFGRAQLAAGAFSKARDAAEQVMLQTPEGSDNAQARLLRGDAYFEEGNFPEAAKDYSVLSLVFQDPALTPRVMARAADAYARAGDAQAAAEWSANLKKRYPEYTP
jgi:tetratricopeptide (TPR) repeat protein